jgi:hypothetical protein
MGALVRRYGYLGGGRGVKPMNLPPLAFSRNLMTLNKILALSIISPTGGTLVRQLVCCGEVEGSIN